MSKVLLAIGITVIAILATILVIVGPLILIWSLNTLFPVLAIQYTLDTWLAVIVLLILMKETSIRIR